MFSKRRTEQYSASIARKGRQEEPVTILKDAVRLLTRAQRHGGVGALFAMIVLSASAGSAGAQSYYSAYIPTAVPTATTTLYTASSSFSPGRIGVDKAGDVFYVSHAGGAATLYELPISATTGIAGAPMALLAGLGTGNSNSAFVDGAGNLWVSNGNGSGGALIEVPAAAGIPNTASITGASGYSATTGLPLTSVTTACAASATVACTYTAASISSNLTSLQVGDIYSDGNGTVTLVDVSDNISNGGYNRLIEFSVNSPGASLNILADRLTSNPYAQVTVAGDGHLYYCDSVTGNSKGGQVSQVNSGALTTVANVPASSLTLRNAIVNVAAATGITTDPWGDLIISGPLQISESPLEKGALNFVDQFSLLVAYSGDNSPVYSSNITYGGAMDVHGSYYYANGTKIMETQVGGYNFGKVNVGTLISTAAPYLNITWDLPSYLETSLSITASPNTLSQANVGYLQSFAYASKSFFGGTPYSAASNAASTPSNALIYFQPAHPGLIRGGLSPQGFSNYAENSDASYSSDYYNNGAYLASLQGVGVGPQPMFLPGIASKVVTQSQLYTSYAHTTSAVGFTPSGVGVDSFGDIFVTDTTNTSLDLDCLSTTANTAQNYRAGAAGNGYTNSYCLTNGLAATNGTNLTGYTFKVSATGVKAGVTFPTNFTTPADVVLDGMNNAYVLDGGLNTPTLTLMPYATMIPSVVIPANAIVGNLPFSNPSGLAIDGYDNVYISDTGNNRIVQARLLNATYSQNIVYVPSTTAFGGQTLNLPGGLGADASGNLFIADTGNRRIVEYSVTGVPSVVTATGTALVNPTSVKVLPSGALVVADSSLGLVLINNGVASVLSTGAIKLQSTQGLTLDFAGNIYVTDPVGGQVVELNVSAPAAATFPATLKPDSSGSHTSSETSYVYNSGNAALNLTAAPAVADTASPADNEFAVDPNNACLASTVLAPNANCNLILDFTPSANSVVYTTVTGTATVTDNLPAVTLTPDPAYASEEIGSFNTAGSSQLINLSGAPVVPFTAQAITFPTPAAVTYTGQAQVVTLNATGGASGQPVVFSIVSGPGILSTKNGVTTITVTNIGTTIVAANEAGALANGIYYSAAPTVTQPVVVNPIGTVATPTFSVASGTYTAVQSVTISDSTAGATIHYTTNGNTPTASSPVYTGQAISVGVTTTIKAIAVGAPGYATSAVAVATYTLNPDFTLSSFNTNLTIPNGLGGSATFTLTPLFGFTGKVTLSCSGINQGDTCSFLNSSGNANPTATYTLPDSNLNLSTGATYGSVVINAQETASAARHQRPLGPPSAVFAMLLTAWGFRKRKRLSAVLLLLFGVIGASMVSGCSASTAPVGGQVHTTTFTLTATSGSIVHTQTITLNVNNLGQ